MKKVFSLFLIFLFLLCSVNIGAEPEKRLAPKERMEAPGVKPAHRPEFSKEDLQKKIEMVKIWELTKSLELSSEGATEVFPVIQATEKNQRTFRESKSKILDQLAEAVKEDSSKKIKSLIAQIQKEEGKFRKEQEELRDKLSSILTPRQQAQYLLFQRSFFRKMRQGLSNVERLRGAKESRRLEK